MKRSLYNSENAKPKTEEFTLSLNRNVPNLQAVVSTSSNEKSAQRDANTARWL